MQRVKDYAYTALMVILAAVLAIVCVTVLTGDVKITIDPDVVNDGSVVIPDLPDCDTAPRGSYWEIRFMDAMGVRQMTICDKTEPYQRPMN